MLVNFVDLFLHISPTHLYTFFKFQWVFVVCFNFNSIRCTSTLLIYDFRWPDQLVPTLDSLLLLASYPIRNFDS